MAATLPSYIASAKPVPLSARQPWYKNTAPTYAGIMLWFVFWQDIASANTLYPGGTLAQGLGVALCGLALAAAICHFLFYLVPGTLGMQTGLPLYIVGTSTYGATGGFLMPGFLMGVLQFGWLGVNTFFSSMFIYNFFAETPLNDQTVYPVGGHAAIAVVWAVLAAFLGLKGIQYVAKVATFLPLIPLVILLLLLAKTIGTIGGFTPDVLIQKAAEAPGGAAAAMPLSPLPFWGVVALLCTYVVGFFATAGAAGVDFGMNNPDAKNVRMGGLVGIALATVFAGGVSLLIVAGAHGAPDGAALPLRTTDLMGKIMGSKRTGEIMLVLLALASFPPACFSSFIAANSFRTTLSNVNPFVSVGIGTAVSILLAVMAWAGKVIAVFQVIGASFGPICGAMVADYLLSGQKWAGPRAGFNMAGWISWAVGFFVGILPLVASIDVPAAPVLAFVVGFSLYWLLAKMGLESARLPMPETTQEPSGSPAGAPR